MKLRMIFFLLFAIAGQTTAQEKNAGEKKKRYVRFLPLGESPPFRQEIRNGVRYELDAAPGAIPPRNVQILFGDKSAADTTLSLGQFSEKIEIPEGATRLRLRKLVQGGESQDWHDPNLPAEAEGDCIVCLWRDPQKKTWEKARSLVLPDGSTAFPAGSIRLINVLPTKVQVESEFGRTELPPGTMKILLLTKQDTPMSVSAVDANQQWRLVYQSSVTQNQGERGNLVVYRADGEESRSPVKVWVGREKVTAP